MLTGQGFIRKLIEFLELCTRTVELHNNSSRLHINRELTGTNLLSCRTEMP